MSVLIDYGLMLTAFLVGVLVGGTVVYLLAGPRVRRCSVPNCGQDILIGGGAHSWEDRA